MQSSLTRHALHARQCSAPACLRAKGRRQLQVHAVFEKFTERSIKAVMMSQQEAKNLGSVEVKTEHLLLGLIAEEGQSKTGYMNSGLSFERVKREVEAVLGKKMPILSQETVPFSREVKKTFETATNECKLTGVNYITPEHILIAIVLQYNSGGRKVLDRLGVNVEGMRAEAVKRVVGEQKRDDMKKVAAASGAGNGGKEGPKALDEFCRDLCAEVQKGRIDPVIGRDNVINRVTQILARRTKNNPILLGEPGVGKTAIAEGLACAIVNNVGPGGAPLPTFLKDKRVLQLDVGLLIAGAKERGELESRITRLISEAKSAGNVILMIDEVHTLVGAGAVGRGGSAGSGLDLSNMLKPALARGELQVIGATTLDEHRKHIERDAALERRFQPVMVDEPAENDALAILEGLRERYERHHRCRYTSEALSAAVHLSHRYIADRFLPDKAIDLIDEAGSRVRIQAYRARQQQQSTPQDIAKMREYLQVMEAKEECVQNQLYEEASILARREDEYRWQLAGSSDTGAILPVVTADDVEAIVASWTGIPVEKMAEDEAEKLADMGPALKECIIGQDDAVDATARAMVRSRCGLKDPDRPIASLLFVGPTGVGKTELAKALARYHFGSEDSMIRLDMSEYMERHSVSKILGSPPGYVGYGEGGTLTEAVRRKPCSIVLFDEIEKAHPDVYSILLQIMEDGRLTDSQGRTVSFKNTLVVLTSNIGSSAIAAHSMPAGIFKGTEYELPVDNSRMVEMVQNEVRQHFRPELLNRLDEVVVFNKLSRPDVRRIAGCMVEETAGRLRTTHDIGLELTPRLMDKVLSEGWSEEWGVRPLRSTIVRCVDDPVCDALLLKRLGNGSTAVVDLDESGEVVVYDQEVGRVEVQGSVNGVGGMIRVETTPGKVREEAGVLVNAMATVDDN